MILSLNSSQHNKQRNLPRPPPELSGGKDFFEARKKSVLSAPEWERVKLAFKGAGQV